MTIIAPVIPDETIASTWGNAVSGAINMSGGRWRRVATLAVAASATVPVNLVFDTEDADDGTMATVPTNTFTIPSDGLWHISAIADTTAIVNARHYLRCTVTSAIAASSGDWRATGYGEAMCILGLALPLNAGDTLAFAVLQNSGGSLNYTAKLSISNGVLR